MTGARRYADLGPLLALHAERAPAIRQRLDEFAAVPESEYFAELLYCLLTPQSSARSAARAVESLRRAGRWDDPAAMAGVLRDRSAYIRFHNTKARRIAEAYRFWPAIRGRLHGEPAVQRRWLVEHVGGLGWKEASHFLRNIGRRNLAILDRHILTNLVHHRVLAARPAGLTPRRYLAIEEEFRRFAVMVGITMDELDLVFWSRETGDILK